MSDSPPSSEELRNKFIEKAFVSPDGKHVEAGIFHATRTGVLSRLIGQEDWEISAIRLAPGGPYGSNGLRASFRTSASGTAAITNELARRSTEIYEKASPQKQAYILARFG